MSAGSIRIAAAAIAASAVLGAGCAALPAYESEMQAARAALDRDDAEAARLALEARLASDGLGGAEAALLRLELATVALGLDDHRAAAAALAEADPLLEVVDLSRDDEGELASWLYADAARPYRAPTWEKLMVNVLGMASRMAAGDLRGALVEARRFEVMVRFFTDAGADPGLVAPLGHLLAAAVHRATGRPAAAERHLATAGGPALPGPVASGEGEVLVVVLAGASDVADTRSWSTLPARVGVARAATPSGPAEIVVGVGAGARRIAVEVRAGRTEVVVVSWPPDPTPPSDPR